MNKKANLEKLVIKISQDFEVDTDAMNLLRDFSTLLRKYPLFRERLDNNELFKLFILLYSHVSTENFKLSDKIFDEMIVFSLLRFSSDYVYETCTDCNGNGRLTCKGCDGEGKTICDKDDCFGGRVFCNNCSDGETINGEECPECEGKGWTFCDSCGGNVGKKCKGCEGEGDIECKYCEGNGDIIKPDVHPYDVITYLSYNPKLNYLITKDKDFHHPFIEEHDFNDYGEVILLGWANGEGIKLFDILDDIYYLISYTDEPNFIYDTYNWFGLVDTDKEIPKFIER